jgi:hypothetical protein
MTFTYGGNPTGSNLDAVRYLIGDTVDAGHLQEDEELTWLLSQQGTVYAAASAAASVLAAKYAPLVSKTVGAMKIEAQQKFDHYMQLAGTLSVQGASLSATLPMPSAPGLSISTKRTRDQDNDLVQPFFRRDEVESVDALVDVT